MTPGFFRPLLCREREPAAGIQHGAVDILQGRESLLMGCGLELSHGHQLLSEPIRFDLAVLDQDSRRPFDEALQPFV